MNMYMYKLGSFPFAILCLLVSVASKKSQLMSYTTYNNMKTMVTIYM